MGIKAITNWVNNFTRTKEEKEFIAQQAKEAEEIRKKEFIEKITKRNPHSSVLSKAYSEYRNTNGLQTYQRHKVGNTMIETYGTSQIPNMPKPLADKQSISSIVSAGATIFN